MSCESHRSHDVIYVCLYSRSWMCHIHIHVSWRIIILNQVIHARLQGSFYKWMLEVDLLVTCFVVRFVFVCRKIDFRNKPSPMSASAGGWNASLGQRATAKVPWTPAVFIRLCPASKPSWVPRKLKVTRIQKASLIKYCKITNSFRVRQSSLCSVQHCVG